MPELSGILKESIAEHLRVIEALNEQLPLLERIAGKMGAAIAAGKKILWFGNGGSAADAQHLAAELVGRFLHERRALASVALTTDSSILTSVGNDYGFENIFSRQVEGICQAGDVVVGISTSGNSKNVCMALERARELGALTIAFTGQKGGLAAGIAEETLAIPSLETPRIQEAHILCGHMLCDLIERQVLGQTVESEARGK
jgi:D-sedoheptulose 7-phosphate isomerase